MGTLRGDAPIGFTAEKSFTVEKCFATEKVSPRKKEGNVLFTVRFWNTADENIAVGGKYSYDFATFDDAWDGANALIKEAHNLGAIEMDINGDFWDIIDD